ncbi:sigma-70 family RNA polymerase sigma factor [Solihabitans fulvus]|uniref:Sigma-70 family RNA polymerase sigma factor n=1 Tax=Solihabitans fulvus TaxID=1892852 RepID=A0A5B2WWK1_9PSEU|nr:sigma-70 family RNA polymerase sigma factor [Solihabitans fulvus]
MYRENVSWVYRLLFARVGNQADAEDLTAEVFLAALRPLRTTASTPQIRAYLAATARTVLAAHWRETFSREITTITGDTEDKRVETGGDAPQRADRILAELPERYRRILQLRFLHAYSIREAAAELGITVANAKVLQHRALRQAARNASRTEGRS